MKIALAGVVLLIAVFVLWNPVGKDTATNSVPTPTDTASVPEGDSAPQKAVITAGKYTVQAENSTVQWSGKKPLIEGYINNGTIGVKEGSIEVNGTAASGTFVIDIGTLTVLSTAKKPGQESKLEEHLKGERWFSVGEFPTATFALTEVTPRADVATTFMYDVRGELTLKGQTHELTFPATIYEDAAGLAHAEASLEFDRTLWGITAGSKNFFDNLADNAVDEMVALSFNLVAGKVTE